MTIAERVAALAEPICADLGVELFDVEHLGGVVRVTVEQPGGVSIDLISLITRELSRALDHADPIPGRYTLEVSSPGLERRLRTPRHRARAVGETVKIKTQPFVEGERRLEGVLVAADERGITVRLADGTERELGHDDLESVRTVFVWGPAPKPGKAGASSGPKKTRDKSLPKPPKAVSA